MHPKDRNVADWVVFESQTDLQPDPPSSFVCITSGRMGFAHPYPVNLHVGPNQPDHVVVRYYEVALWVEAPTGARFLESALAMTNFADHVFPSPGFCLDLRCKG